MSLKKLSRSIRVFNSTGGNRSQTTLGDIIKNNTVLISVPGAFTPTCSLKHVPDYIEKANLLKQNGASQVVVSAVNDPFVVEAWSKSLENSGNVVFISDAFGELAEALGQTKDLSGAGLGKRSTRFSTIINKDLEVLSLNVDEDLGYEKSKADVVIEQLKGLKDRL